MRVAKFVKSEAMMVGEDRKITIYTLVKEFDGESFASPMMRVAAPEGFVETLDNLKELCGKFGQPVEAETMEVRPLESITEELGRYLDKLETPYSMSGSVQ